MPRSGPDARPPLYAERLFPPWSWWLLGLLFVVSVGWAFFVATPMVATVVAVVVTTALVGALLVRVGQVRIVVDDTSLRAGRAVLPRQHVGEVAALDAAATRRTIGPGADARAYLVTRPYVATAVRVTVDDDRDPTPYWLVSTRHPDRLAESLRGRVQQD